jgi:hypothetical protein
MGQKPQICSSFATLDTSTRRTSRAMLAAGRRPGEPTLGAVTWQPAHEAGILNATKAMAPVPTEYNDPQGVRRSGRDVPKADSDRLR